MAGRGLSSNTASNGKTSTSRRRKMRGKIGVGFGKWRILKPRGVSRDDSVSSANLQKPRGNCFRSERKKLQLRSEEHTSELQSLMRISYAVFCLKNKKKTNN